MALSNIFNEPRREITESLIGIAAFTIIAVPVVYWDYQWAVWLQANAGDNAPPVPIGMMLIAFAAFVAFALFMALLAITHFMGEKICDALQDAGIRLRPRRMTLRDRGW